MNNLNAFHQRKLIEKMRLGRPAAASAAQPSFLLSKKKKNTDRREEFAEDLVSA